MEKVPVERVLRLLTGLGEDLSKYRNSRKCERLAPLHCCLVKISDQPVVSEARLSHVMLIEARCDGSDHRIFTT